MRIIKKRYPKFQSHPELDHIEESAAGCDCDIIHQDLVDSALADQPDTIKLLQLSELFKVIGDSTRIKILWALDNREMCVCDLANVLNMTKAATSYHLTTLRETGLVKYQKRGKEIYYTMQDEHVRDLYEIGIAHIAHYQCDQTNDPETTANAL